MKDVQLGEKRKRMIEDLHKNIKRVYRKNNKRSDTKKISTKDEAIHRAVKVAETYAWKKSRTCSEPVVNYAKTMLIFHGKINNQTEAFKKLKQIGFVNGSGDDEFFVSGYDDMKHLNTQKKIHFWYSGKL